MFLNKIYTATELLVAAIGAGYVLKSRDTIGFEQSSDAVAEIG